MQEGNRPDCIYFGAAGHLLGTAHTLRREFIASSIQAGRLRDVLDSDATDLAARLNRADATVTYPVWTMNAIGDLTLHGAAETDPVLAEWFLRRFSLLDTLYLVPSPRIVGRAIRRNMGLCWQQRRTASAGPRDRDPAPSR